MGQASTPTGDVPIAATVGCELLRSPADLQSTRPVSDRCAQAAAIALLALVVGFCAFVEIRVGTAQKRRIDLDVVLRAAWAVRTGENPYTVTNERGWHYNLPPLTAILLVPLAEPPPELGQTRTVPILVTLAIWNIVGHLALAASVHLLAWTAQRWSPFPEVRNRLPGCWQWWAVRAVPVATSLPAIAITLNRGQVNLFLTALLCCSAAAVIRGQRLGAGVWLAGAICLKIIPAFLILYPLWKRDLRWLAGTALGLVIGLGVIPAIVFGPERAAEYFWDLSRSVLLPGLSLGGDGSRMTELIDLHASNSQSFQVLFSNLANLGKPPEHSQASTGLRLAHWLVGAALTLVTLRAGAQWPDSAIRTIIRFGALAMLMVAVSPASHDHYFCVNLLLISGLVTATIDSGGPRLGGRCLTLLLVVYIAACALPMIPELRVLRDIRLPLIGSLALWLAGILILRSRPDVVPVRMEKVTEAMMPTMITLKLGQRATRAEMIR